MSREVMNYDLDDTSSSTHIIFEIMWGNSSTEIVDVISLAIMPRSNPSINANRILRINS